ncbi:MAG: GNAT family N-acetyltransferase [Planctomycetota bacterium]
MSETGKQQTESQFESKTATARGAGEQTDGADAMTAVMIDAMAGAAVRVGLVQDADAAVARRSPALRLAGGPSTRRARVADVAGIMALIDAWADLGLTIRRSAGDVLASVDDFVVAELEGTIVACGAIESFRCEEAQAGVAGAGEIRSVSVAHTARGLGVGKAVVHELVRVGELRGLGEVVLLTKTPGFFASCGFEAIEAGAAPAGFVAQRVEGRGRTVVGRSVMRRIVVPAPAQAPGRASSGAATVVR